MKSNRGAHSPKRSDTRIALAVYLALIVGCLISIPAYAQSPTGGVVTSGSATISQSGATTNIDQSTTKAVINWDSFSIGSGYTVNFNQPSVSSVTLNRVVGSSKSIIEGVLNATGQVFLVNANGILLTKGSVVNTAGFAASTLDISNTSFNTGNYVFTSTGANASVINQGTINAAAGGYVALLGNYVSNQGVITATKGTAALASGDEITLNFNGDSLLSVTVNKGTLDALVENKQAIYADGGTVILTAKAADNLVAAQVNNTGLIQAQTIGDLTGKISLIADGGATSVDGTLDASAPNGGNGGAIETSGNTVTVADTAKITTLAANGTTGSWLLDPDSFTIAASGGDITGATLSSELNSTNVTLKTTSPVSSTSSDGNMYVNDTISWSAATTLELDATNNVYVNKSITASGAGAGLTLAATKGSVYVDAPITMSGSNDTLTMNANTTSGIVYINDASTMSGASNDAVVINAKDYSINTLASYAGTTSDGSSAKTNTSGGTYGSLSFTSSLEDSSGDSLTINGDKYTLIYNMADLINAGYSQTAYLALRKKFTGTCASGSGTCTWDVATQAYDIPYFKNTGTCTTNSAMTCAWDPTTQAYDIYYATSYISGVTYYYDVATGKYDIPQLITTNQNEYGSTYYWDPYTNAYDLLVIFTTSSYYWYLNPASGKYDTLTRPDLAYGGAYLYDPATGKYDITSYADTYYYALAKNIDASGTTYTSSPITYFSGTLTGLGHEIDNLTISTTGTTSPYLGLITYDVGGVIRDLGMSNVNIYGLYAQAAGSLVADDWEGTYYNDYVINGSVVTGYATSGYSDPGVYGYGSLIGYGHGTNIDSVYTNSTVEDLGSTTYAWAGGLIGYLGNGSITESSSDSTVYGTSGNYYGGLVGELNTGSISDSYATGDVVGGNYVGGLVGYVFNTSTLTDDFATGEVTAVTGAAGGLVGATQSYQLLYSTSVYNTITISNTYATGDVYGYSAAGGLVGMNGTGGNQPSYETIEDSYATGDVTGGNNAGGLVGYNDGVIDSSYATGDVSLTGIMSGTIGTLVGTNTGITGIIEDSYATGDVVLSNAQKSGTTVTVGSIVGTNSQGASITNSYATGDIDVTGDVSKATVNIGLIAGYNQGYLSNLWTDTSVSVGGVDTTASTSAVATTYSGVSGQRGSYSGYSEELYFTSPEYRLSLEQIGSLQGDVQSSVADELNSQDDDDSGVKNRSARRASGAVNPGARLKQPSILEGSISYGDSNSYGAHVKAVESEGVEFNLDSKKKAEQCDDKDKGKEKK